MPELDWPLLVSRFLHLAAAMVALGGVAFQRVILLPGLRTWTDEESRGRLVWELSRRTKPLTHACIAVLLLTGGFNFVRLALIPRIDPVPYHFVFGIKFAVALGVFSLVIALAGQGPGFEAMRKRKGFWLTCVLWLGGGIVLLSGGLGQIRNAGQRPRAANATAPSPLLTVELSEHGSRSNP